MRYLRKVSLLFLALSPLLLPSLSFPAAIDSTPGGGPWSQTTTWVGGIVPTAVDTVTIVAASVVTVDIATATASTITVNGTLTFSTVAHSSLTLVRGSLIVEFGGSLILGTESTPIPANVRATLVLASGTFAAQYGLIINDGGTFMVRGAAKTPYGFATASILAGAISLTIPASSAIGWQIGDTITIGPTEFAPTEERGITSITGTDPLTISWSGGLSTARTLSSERPILVANITRNVLVRSSGTVVTGAGANSAYIQNSAGYTSGRFESAYGEFAYLGSLDGARGVDFLASARGSISSCTVRHGFYGVNFNYGNVRATVTANNIYNNREVGFRAANMDNNSVFKSNNVYGSRIGIQLEDVEKGDITGNFAYNNSDIGIYVISGVVGGSNTFTSNAIYSNGVGVFLYESHGNTWINNRCYVNGIGFSFNSNSRQDILIDNDIFSNNIGVSFDALTQNTTWVKNYIHGNPYGLYVNQSSNNVFIEDRLGYDRSGNSIPNQAGEIYFTPSSNANITLKNVRVNPTIGINTTGFNKSGNYLLSYNQELDNGSLRIWGDYQISGSTLTLEYANRLYTSTTTTPKLMRGSANRVTVNSTNDSNAKSQLITVTFRTSDNRWHVVGSVDGELGTLPITGGTADFPAASPQLNLSIASGGLDGDKVDFLLIAASNDANTRKKLLFGSSDSAFNNGKSKLTVAPSGGLKVIGAADTYTLVDRISGNNFYALVDSGAFTMAFSTMQNMDSGGLWLSGNAGVSIATSTFDFIGVPATTAAYITAAGLSSNATFYNVNFLLSRSTATASYAYNVLVLAPDNNLSWSFFTASGAFSGADYEHDPNGRVQWLDLRPRVTSLSPASGNSCVMRNSSIVITFDKDMEPSSLGPAFSVRAIRDSLGNTINQLISGTTVYASRQLTFSGTLAGNTLYQVELTAQARDSAGFNLVQAVSFQFQTLMNRSELNVFRDAASGISVTVPAGALGGDGIVRLSLSVSPRVSAANQKLISNTGDSYRYPLGTVSDLKAYDASCQTEQNVFASPVTVSIPYLDSNNDGIVDASNPPVRASTLGVWWLDETNALWVKLPTSQLDSNAKRISAQAPHFTTFASIGASDSNVSETFAFPVPFKPSSGHTNITFAGLPQTATIKIFTVSGKLVRTLDTTDASGKLVWDVKSSDGNDVASGVYIYLVTSGSNTKTGKLVIVR